MHGEPTLTQLSTNYCCVEGCALKHYKEEKILKCTKTLVIFNRPPEEFQSTLVQSISCDGK